MIDKIKGLLKLLLIKIIVFFFNLIFWDRKKDVLVVWVVVITLFLRPVKNADAIYLIARPPPEYADEVERDKLLKKGYEILGNYWYGDGTKESLQIAKKIFDSVYKKTGNPVALNLNYLTDHYLAIEDKTYLQSKARLLDMLKSVEERLKSYPDDIYALGQKQITLKALFHAAHGLYFDKEEYKKYQKKDEMDLYYGDGIRYGKKLIEFENEYLIKLNNSDVHFYDPKGPQALSKEYLNRIKDFIKKELQENEKMYEEVVNEKRNH